MTVLQDIYFLTSCLGFAYIVGSALLGTFHNHGAGTQSHGTAHSGHSHAPGQSCSHTAHLHGTGSAHSHGTGSAHCHGAGSAHSHGTTPAQQSNPNDSRTTLSISQSTSTALNPSKSDIPAIYLRVLDLLNPTKLAFFAFLFGASGMIFGRFLPGYLSMLPAAIIGWTMANLFFSMLGNIFSRMNSSTNFKKEYLIGATGELSVSIEAGSVGEVVVSTGNSRYTSRARAADSRQSIKKLAKVIVVDIKDDIFIVETFDDASLLSDMEQEKP